MRDPNVWRERIQFPLRALFAFTLFAAVLAAAARWMISFEDSGPLIASLAIGFTVGLATILIAQQVRLTWFLVSLLLGLVCVNGSWFPSHSIAYGCGLLAGAIINWKGLRVLNALLGWLGFTISKREM